MIKFYRDDYYDSHHGPVSIKQINDIRNTRDEIDVLRYEKSKLSERVNKLGRKMKRAIKKNDDKLNGPYSKNEGIEEGEIDVPQFREGEMKNQSTE